MRDVSSWYERSLVGKVQEESFAENKWSGQLSNEAFVLDVLPFLTLTLQGKSHSGGHHISFQAWAITLTAFLTDGIIDQLESLQLPTFRHPAYADHMTNQEELTAKEDRLKPEDEDMPDDLDRDLQPRRTHDDQFADEEIAAPTWLDDDDIDEF